MDLKLKRRLKKVRERSPSSDREAEKRYNKWKSKDPFPEISSSLLNAADFCDYITKAGILYPFDPYEKDIKIATYSFKIGGKILQWPEGSKGRIEMDIEDGEEFKIYKNSISYVTLRPYLRIPEYIALRFNLKIDNVYKGLLLGTGPIIDPGYQGKLSIPLHNLTNNNYTLKGGQRIIWVEFTKISSHPYWSRDKDTPGEINLRHPHLHIPYEPPKKLRDVKYHLDEALADQKEEIDRVQSSLGAGLQQAVEASERASEAASKAEGKAEDARNQAFKIAGGTILAAILSVLAVLGGIGAVVSRYHSDVNRLREEVHSLEQAVENRNSLNSERDTTKSPTTKSD